LSKWKVDSEEEIVRFHSFVTTVLFLAQSVVCHVSIAEEMEMPQTERAAIIEWEWIRDRLEKGGKAPPDALVAHTVPLLRFLDSDNPVIRKTATDAFRTLAQMDAAIRLDECIPYLASERPVKERVSLLILCLEQIGETGEHYSGKGTGEKVKAIAREVIDADICPPHFDLLAVVLAARNNVWKRSRGKAGVNITESVTETKRPVIARRLLRVMELADVLYKYQTIGLRHMKERNVKRGIFEAILGLGEQQVGQVVEDWYRSEPDPALRAIVVDESLSWWKDATWVSRRNAILEIAAKDWDEEIATKAKALVLQNL